MRFSPLTLQLLEPPFQVGFLLGLPHLLKHGHDSIFPIIIATPVVNDHYHHSHYSLVKILYYSGPPHCESLPCFDLLRVVRRGRRRIVRHQQRGSLIAQKQDLPSSSTSFCKLCLSTSILRSTIAQSGSLYTPPRLSPTPETYGELSLSSSCSIGPTLQSVVSEVRNNFPPYWKGQNLVHGVALEHIRRGRTKMELQLTAWHAIVFIVHIL